MSERYYVSGDNSGHRYMVPVARQADFEAWASLPEDDENGWDAPEYATRIDGGILTFEAPRIERLGEGE